LGGSNPSFSKGFKKKLTAEVTFWAPVDQSAAFRPIPNRKRKRGWKVVGGSIGKARDSISELDGERVQDELKEKEGGQTSTLWYRLHRRSEKIRCRHDFFGLQGALLGEVGPKT